MEDPRVRRKRVIAGLLRGKALAARLQAVLRKPTEPSREESELTVEICRSFSQAIVELSSGSGPHQIRQISAASVSSARRLSLAGSGQTSGGGHRARYKKRKNCDESWTEISKTMEDGGAWRKYGQKKILHSQFPRCYYRCTHKYAQGCKASKQVQQTKEGLYEVTYLGCHTCNNPHRSSRQPIAKIADQNDVVSIKKEDEDAAQSEVTQTIPQYNNGNDNDNNNFYYGDENGECDDDIWGDIIGQCTYSSFNDRYMERTVADLGTLFPFDDEEIKI